MYYTTGDTTRGAPHLKLAARIWCIVGFLPAARFGLKFVVFERLLATHVQPELEPCDNDIDNE